MEKTKVSVIGVGHLGSIHTKLWHSIEGAELIGIFDTEKEKSVQISKEQGISSFSSIDELLSNSQAVTIASPTVNHYEIALKCIEKGVHCFIEKPICSTYSEAMELISMASSKNVIIQVGHVERFNPALASLSGLDLNPVFIEAHRLSQFKPRATDVSVIHDLMIHDIDIVLWLVKSEVEKIDANGVAVLTDTPDIANARITFKSGAVANLTASRISANPMRKMRLFQQDSYISIDFGLQDVEIFRLFNSVDELKSSSIPATMLGTIEAGTKNKNIGFQKPEIPKINAIQEEQKSFINAIKGIAPVPVTALDAAKALQVAEIIGNMI